MQELGTGRPTTAVFSLSALAHNLQEVKNKIGPKTKILGMVKANAYGHGIVQVAKSLTCDAFGVAGLEEAVLLRTEGITAPIFVLSGFLSEADLHLAIQYSFGLIIHSDYQIEKLSCFVAEKRTPIEVWLKMDLGMHRLGFPPEEIPEAYQKLKACSSVHVTTLISHMSCDDNRLSEETPQQIAVFNKVAAQIPLARSLANSAAIVAWPESHQHTQWVRPGIMLYGISPMANEKGTNLNLKPVMLLKSNVIAIQTVKANDPVSYGATWHAPKEGATVAVVAVGYGDGYPRHAKIGTPVLIKGKRFPLVGRVCMDMIMVDISTHPQITIGDEVILWGDKLPVEEIAQCSGTIGYELCCHLTSRVKRLYLEDRECKSTVSTYKQNLSCIPKD